MKSSDAHAWRYVRRLNRRVHDAFSAWLGGASRALAKPALPRAPWPGHLPERQDLYGFSASDVPCVSLSSTIK